MFIKGWGAGISIDENQMTYDDTTGLYVNIREYTAEAGETIEFKIVQDGATWIGPAAGGDYTITFEEDGTYTVTFTFNAETEEVNVDTVLLPSGGSEETP